jgi:hypothetical protein
MADEVAARKKTTTTTTVDVDEVDAFTVEEFCRRHRISVKMFYKRPDLMPDSFSVGTRRLIGREAAAAWRKANSKPLQKGEGMPARGRKAETKKREAAS